jgi:hypothetical protein
MMKDPVTPLVAAVLLCAAASFCPAPAFAADRVPVVVELFTSQGCSSCPPADAVLGELTRRADVLALSFHVTYWDRLGWPDTFGLEAGTARQDAYAQWLGQRRVYTPQMVIGGRLDVVGSARGRVQDGIQLIASNAPAGPELRVDGQTLTIGAGRAEPATIWLIGFDAAHDVPIARGENRGKTLRYHNVVREITKLGDWRGQPLKLELPVRRYAAEGRDGLAILLQRTNDGAILTATRVSLTRD